MSTSRMMFNLSVTRRRHLMTALICLALAVLTVACFAAVKDNGFINLDDNRYVYENPHVQSGLNAGSVKYAFSFDVSNWHPLTWLSLIADHHFFGLDPSGYHLVNLLLHVVNTILLFLVLRRMTKAAWAPAFVAAAFAIHPLHVESVAWVAGRKDVLSGFFWILGMGAYGYYAEKPGVPRYSLVLLLFILGLTAKPMLVTFPFVLLLLDYWPLRRIGDLNWSQIRPVLLEKIPLFILTVLSCVITYVAQRKGGALSAGEAIEPLVRLGNALVSYIAYIGQMIWPASLAVLYPHPGVVITRQILGSIIVLAAVTAFVVRQAGRAPYLLTGWLWYLGTLVPVIGIVQVGCQARADRYTYIPLIGLFIMAAWGVADLSGKWKFPKAILPAVSTGILFCFSMATWTQVGYWHSNLTLYDRTLEITQNNWIIYNNRGNVHNSRGNYRLAIEDYNRAIESRPDYADAYANRGAAYNGLENYPRAVEDFSRAIKIKPVYAEAYINRGSVYNNMGDFRRALEDLTRGIAIKPGYAQAYFSRGIAHHALGNDRQATEDFSRAIDLKPDDAMAYVRRAILYFSQGNHAPGCRDAQKVCDLGNCEVLEAARNDGYCR